MGHDAEERSNRTQGDEAMNPCAFFSCTNDADPRWGGYCDGHGATTVDELTCRTSVENAVLRAEVERLTGGAGESQGKG